MTISSTRSYDPTIDAIVKKAMVLSGLLNPAQSITSTNNAAAAEVVREHLADVMDELPSRGVTLRHVAFTEQTLTAGTYKYVQDASVIDVLGDAMYIDAGDDVDEANGETLVTQVTMDHWNRLSAKDASGRPTQMFAYRTGPTIELRLWPIPDEAGTLRFQANVKPADSLDGSKTPDMPSYWRSYLQFEIASRYLMDTGGDMMRIQMYAQKAEQLFKYARNKGQTRPYTQASVGHRNPWRR